VNVRARSLLRNKNFTIFFAQAGGPWLSRNNLWTKDEYSEQAYKKDG
jgi:hypothetical protein